MIYLDNAATTFPKPKSVINAVNNCLKQYSANPGRSGHNLSQRAAEEVVLCRSKVADFFGGESAESVVFTPNCTAAINMVLKGILKPRDHVICSCLEHNAVIRPLNKLSTYGVEYDIASVFPENPMTTVSSFEALIKKNTKLIICTHASNVSGTVLPIKDIGQLAHDYGIKFAVDAAQTAGVLNINMKEMNIDYLCIAPHKGLYAPMGTGILIANSEIPDTIIEGGTGSMSKLPLQPEILPDRLESGTVNLSGIAGISAGLDFVKSKGINNIYIAEFKHMLSVHQSLTKMPNVKLYSSMVEMGNTAPVLSFNIADKDSEEVGADLNRMGIAVRSGLHCAPLAHRTLGTYENGTVRICPSVFTTNSDIDTLIQSIKILAKT